MCGLEIFKAPILDWAAGIISLAKPSIVQHEQFNPSFNRRLRLVTSGSTQQIVITTVLKSFKMSFH